MRNLTRIAFSLSILGAYVPGVARADDQGSGSSADEPAVHAPESVATVLDPGVNTAMPSGTGCVGESPCGEASWCLCDDDGFVHAQLLAPEPMVPPRLAVYERDDDGRITTESHFSEDGTRHLLTITTSYDEHGQVLVERYFDGSGALDRVTTFQRDANGQATGFVTTGADPNDVQYVERREWRDTSTYVVTTDRDGDGVDDSCRTQVLVEGRVLSDLVDDCSGGDSFLTTYAYDQEGRVIVHETMPNGDVTRAITREMTYGDGDLVIEMTTRYAADGTVETCAYAGTCEPGEGCPWECAQNAP